MPLFHGYILAVFPAVKFFMFAAYSIGVTPLLGYSLRNKRRYQRPAFLSFILDLRCKKRRLPAVTKLEFDYVLFPFGIERLAEVAEVCGTDCVKRSVDKI
jgi:hypothetical protein